MKDRGFRVFYTPNGVRIHSNFPAERLVRESLLFVGRIDRMKSPHLAIKLAKMCKRPLRIVGPITDLGYYRSRVQPELGGQIAYVGEVSDQRLEEIFHDSSGLVYIGTYNDPLPDVLLRSITHGVPVIGIRPGPFSGFHDVVVDGRNGVVSDSIEGLAARIDDLDHFDSARITAEALEKWSWDSVIRRFYEPTFKQLLAA
jgi:glycosyltransferase involved in cell wall biosynthesis